MSGASSRSVFRLGDGVEPRFDRTPDQIDTRTASGERSAIEFDLNCNCYWQRTFGTCWPGLYIIAQQPRPNSNNVARSDKRRVKGARSASDVGNPSAHRMVEFETSDRPRILENRRANVDPSEPPVANVTAA